MTAVVLHFPLAGRLKLKKKSVKETMRSRECGQTGRKQLPQDIS